MADERDPGVSRRYRELGAEEPSRHVDEAILAASRRRWKWYYPAAAAAVIVLAVAVTIHVERERPDPESAVLMRAPQPAQEAGRGARPTEESRADSAVREKREAQPSAPAVAPAPASKPSVAEPPRAARDEAASARALEAPAAGMLGKQLAEEPPEKMLERIAELRRQGRHEEADKALEAFRKRYPAYKLPESVLKK
jgi:hypothetical protein